MRRDISFPYPHAASWPLYRSAHRPTCWQTIALAAAQRITWLIDIHGQSLCDLRPQLERPAEQAKAKTRDQQPTTGDHQKPDQTAGSLGLKTGARAKSRNRRPYRGRESALPARVSKRLGWPARRQPDGCQVGSGWLANWLAGPKAGCGITGSGGSCARPRQQPICFYNFESGALVCGFGADLAPTNTLAETTNYPGDWRPAASHWNRAGCATTTTQVAGYLSGLRI